MLVTAGEKTGQVPGDLGLSETTLKVHRSNAQCQKWAPARSRVSFIWQMRLTCAYATEFS
jgi:FixJ family two-component response regulator